MTPERLQQLEAVFTAAAELPAGERAAYLAEACADDHALRREVESLLAHDGENGAAPELPITPPALHALVHELESRAGGADGLAEATLPLPTQLGGYRLTAVLGRGGMGVVYRAEQERPRRVVAIKVIRAGVISPRTIRRFEYEVELLARLRHHGIAQIYEAGAVEHADAPGGKVAYFAMELVDGQPITRFAAARQLDIRGRLTLVAQVCDAVQHAHQNGVIHRDLKPGNIIVNADGVPKVLDFGVGRMVDADKRLTTVGTDLGQIVGTLPYMSPEQVSGDPDAVDTRTDVYALGVNLYELLTGELPLALDRRTLAEAARIIRDEEPTRLSRRNRIFRGDVDTIVGKALEKDPDRRYQSAAGLAADIRHYLAGEPISARRDSGWYLLRKTLARYRVAVGALTAVFATATAAAIALVFMYGRQADLLEEVIAAKDAQQVALAEAVTLNEFFQDVVRHANPFETGKADLSMREFLDFVVAALDAGRLREMPMAEANTRTTVAASYEGLAVLDAAERQARHALAIVQRQADRSDQPGRETELANCHRLLGQILESSGDAVGAERELTAALALLERQPEGVEKELALTVGSLSAVTGRLGRLDEAEAYARRALEIERARGVTASAALANAHNQLGVLARRRGNHRIAQFEYRQALAIWRALRGDNTSLVVSTLTNLGVACAYDGDFQQAAECYEEAYRIAIKVFGERHPQTARILNGLGGVYSSCDDLDAAERVFRQAVDIQLEHLGPGHQATQTTLFNIAAACYDSQREEEALAILLDVRDYQFITLPADHPSVGSVSAQVALNLLALGRPREAELYAREALDIRRQHLPDRWGHGSAASLLGQALSELGLHEEAEALLLDGIERVEADPTAPDKVRRAVLERAADHFDRIRAPLRAALIRDRIPPQSD